MGYILPGPKQGVVSESAVSQYACDRDGHIMGQGQGGGTHGKGKHMVEAGTKKTLVVAALFVLLCSLTLLASRATALPYAHSEAEAEAGSGLVHVAATLDCTEVGGSITTAWLPINADDATVKAVMNEFLTASESKVDRFAHEDYTMKSMADFLSDKDYTVAVYKAGGQQPGAEATYTSTSIGDESYTGLVTGDGVYVTVTK